MVEIIPKKPARKIPFQNVLLFAAGTLLLAAIFGYVIIIRSEAGALTALGDLEGGIAKLGTRGDRATEVKVFDSEKRIEDFGILLASRRKSSNFFDNFAGLIHPQVWLSKIELDVAGLKALVSGESPNFKILQQQLIFFQNQKDLIESIELSKISIGQEGGAEFNINFNFKPEIFN